MCRKYKAFHRSTGYKKILALTLAFTMLCSMIFTYVFAIDPISPDEYLCGHVHDEACGFTEGREGEACTHEHDESCYKTVQQCTHEHDESCGDLCGHVCDADCNVTELSCNHIHDGSCGYAEPVSGTPCSHICEILSFNDNTSGEAISTYIAKVGETYDSICAALPETLPGTLVCSEDDVDIPVCWTCDDFIDEPGTYTFRAELENVHCIYAVSDDVLTEDVDESELPFITVTVTEAAAPAPTTAPPNSIYTISDDTNNVSVTGSMPEGARLEVRALTEEELAAYVAEDVNVVFAYDIKIMIPDGEGEAEYQPTSENPVTVTITPPQPIEAPTVEVIHIAEDADAGEPTSQTVENVSTTENTVAFEAEGFSIYIGTTPPTLVDVSELYYNGSGFFTDVDCTETNQVKDAGGAAFTDMQTLINHVAGDLTIHMKTTYTVSGTQSITGGTVYNVMLKRHSDYTGALITVSTDGDLTLSNITIDGGAVWSIADPTTRTNSGLSATAAAVSVDGTLTLNSGAVVQNNNNTTTGGGVYVNSGTFTMNGGTVSGNASSGNGGGVYVNSGTFTMSGGMVSGNTANYGNGVYVDSYGTVTVTGGSVTSIDGVTPTSNGSTAVTCHTITLVNGAFPAITPVMADRLVTELSLSTGSYGITDVKTDASGKLYIWLPAVTTVLSASVSGRTYTGTSATGDDTSFYSTCGYIFVNGSVAASGDGTTAATAYKTFAEALPNASGKTIVVCGPTEITELQTVSDNVTITSVLGDMDYRTSVNALLKRSNDANGDGTTGDPYSGSLFNVTGSLTLQDVTIDGGAVWSITNPATRTNSGITASASAINVSAGGFLGLNSGAVVRNNDNEAPDIAYGGAVLNNGTFTINGGTLTNNSASSKGGAVFSTGIFTLNSGTMGGNSSRNADGGAVYNIYGSFTMSGGSILGNTARFGGGGVYTHSAGSTFNMSGGTISGNEGNGGVYVCASSSFTMSGGEISGNIGSGVMVYNNATFTMNGGTVSGNTSDTGGGVNLYGDYKGEGSTFNMNGGTVSGNIARVNGGGVFVFTNGASTICRFNMSGGTISGNTVDGMTNGVRIKEGDFTLSGSPDLLDTVSLGEAQHIAVATGGFAPTDPVKLVLNAEFIGGSEVVCYADSIANAATELAKFSLLIPGCSLVQGGSGNENKLLLSTLADAVYLNGAGGLDTNDGSTPESAVQTLKMAYEKLASNGGVIYICGQVTVSSGSITLSGTGYSDDTTNMVNIINGSVSIWRYSQPTANTGWPAGYTGTLIDVASDGSLTLGNIELNGHSYATATAPEVAASASLVKVGSGASLNVNAGATLRNNSNSNSSTDPGGGVHVNGGTFTMNSGTISGNTANSGGGVYVTGGTFTISGDAGITNNTAIYGGGVNIAASSQITMSSGMISGNKATGNGGGVYANNSTFTMSDGSISGNTAVNGGGMYANNSTFNLSGGAMSGNTAASSGGGVFVYANTKMFSMTGGTVSDNTATDGNGGGVFVSSGTFDMSAGSISGNTAENGAGVYVNSTFTLSGSPSLAGEVYLKAEKSITVNAAFTPVAPVPVTGEGFTAERVIATYGAGLSPVIAHFRLSDAPYSLAIIDGRSIVITSQFNLQGTVTMAGEGVALGAGQSKTYTLSLEGLFATGTAISISKVTPTEGLTLEAYNTVYQNRRNYGYTKANSTFGLSVTKTGGAETDSYAEDYDSGISLGQVTAGDTLTFTVYNANAITNPNPAGSFTVTLSDGSSTVDVVININRRSDIQLNVTVPIQITASMDAAGTFTFPDGDDYAVVNNSSVPVAITNMSWAWAADNISLFVDSTKLSASISLGASETPYNFTYTNRTCTPGSDGSIVAHNGIVPGRLPLHWGLTLGAGNALAVYPGNGISVQIATVTYTIDVAEGEFASG